MQIMRSEDLLSLFNKNASAPEALRPKNEERKFGLPNKPKTGLYGLIHSNGSKLSDWSNPYRAEIRPVTINTFNKLEARFLLLTRLVSSISKTKKTYVRYPVCLPVTPKIKSPKFSFETIKESVLLSKKSIDNPKINNLFFKITCFL